MKIARILKINFRHLSQPALVIKAGEINAAIHSPEFIADFPQITPTAEQIAAALAAFRNSVEMENSKSVAALRKANRETLVDLLVRLALDLEQQADGDMLKLSRTGYDINKTPGGQTTGNTPTPQNLRLDHGLRNQVIARVQAIEGNVVYIGAFTYDPINGPWTTINLVTNSQKIIFNNLERGRDLFVKVMADGPHGPSDWSDIATIMVQ